MNHTASKFLMHIKMYLVIFGVFLSCSGFIFASTTSQTIVITNRSNAPIIVQWISSVSKNWTPSIPAGGTYNLPYTGSLTNFNLFYLVAGTSIAGGVGAQAAQVLDQVGGKPVGFGGAIGAASSSAFSASAPLSVFIYGDAATAVGMLTAAPSVVVGTAGAQLILPAGSQSRAVEFVTGTLTAADESKGAQPVIMQSFSTDGKYTLNAY